MVNALLLALEPQTEKPILPPGFSILNASAIAFSGSGIKWNTKLEKYVSNVLSWNYGRSIILAYDNS